MKRNHNIDLLRFVLILLVIQLHMNPYSGVTVLYSVFNVHLVVWMFMLISLYLLQVRGAMFRRVKWVRLLLPYLSWSIIYLCLRSLKHMIQVNKISFEAWTLNAFFTGGAAVHMYFIPLLIVYQLFACALSNLFLIKAVRSKQILNFGILIATFLISNLFGLKSTIIGSKWGLFIDALFATVCVHALVYMGANAGPVRSNLCKIILVFSALVLLWWQTNIDDQVLVKIMIASSILYTILRMPVSSKLGQFDCLFTASFGIFLMHHAIIEMAEALFTQLGIPLIPYDFAERILGTFAVVSISYGFICLIRRSRLLSLLLIGEKHLK